jgi:hypothetical protein
MLFLKKICLIRNSEGSFTNDSLQTILSFILSIGTHLCLQFLLLYQIYLILTEIPIDILSIVLYIAFYRNEILAVNFIKGIRDIIKALRVLLNQGRSSWVTLRTLIGV